MTCAVRGWCVGKSRRPKTKMISLEQQMSSHPHAAVGTVENAGVPDNDGTRRPRSHRWTDRNGNVGCVKSALVLRCSQVDLHLSSGWVRAGHAGQTLPMYGTRDAAVNLARCLLRSITRLLNESWSCVLRVLLQPIRKITLAYVAQDMVDIAEAVKCFTRHM